MFLQKKQLDKGDEIPESLGMKTFSWFNMVCFNRGVFTEILTKFGAMIRFSKLLKLL